MHWTPPAFLCNSVQSQHSIEVIAQDGITRVCNLLNLKGSVSAQAIQDKIVSETSDTANGYLGPYRGSENLQIQLLTGEVHQNVYKINRKVRELLIVDEVWAGSALR
jgi:hypothetical protein